MSATIGGWLDARTVDVPPRLATSVRDALGDDLAEDAHLVPERCVAAAERIVDALLRRGETGRDSALALLTADALVTYAFEAAADEPDAIIARAQAAMRTLGTLA